MNKYILIILSALSPYNACYSVHIPKKSIYEIEKWRKIEIIDEHEKDHHNFPLLYAVKKRNLDTVKKLIDAGINCNEQNKRGITALMIAARYNTVSIAEELINAGSNLDIHDFQKQTALMYAVLYGANIIAEKLIIAQADLDLTDMYGFTALSHAILYNPSLAQTLINNKANLNTPTYRGDTPLVTAIRYKKTSLIYILLKAGADVNNKNSLFINPLIMATKNNDIKLVKKLLKKNAYINIQDYYNMTPLIIAAHSSYYTLLKELVAKGALLDLIKGKGNTPFNTLCRRSKGFLDTIRELDTSPQKCFIAALDNELVEIFIQRLLNQKKYPTLIDFIALLKLNKERFLHYSPHIKNLCEFMSAWNKNILESYYAYDIISGNNAHQSLEHTIYYYAKKHDIKPLGSLIRNWACTYVVINKHPLIFPEIASYIGYY